MEFEKTDTTMRTYTKTYEPTWFGRVFFRGKKKEKTYEEGWVKWEDESGILICRTTDLFMERREKFAHLTWNQQDAERQLFRVENEEVWNDCLRALNGQRTVEIRYDTYGWVDTNGSSHDSCDIWFRFVVGEPRKVLTSIRRLPTSKEVNEPLIES